MQGARTLAGHTQHENNLSISEKYSRTLMAQTSLGSWKFVLDMGNSSHSGLIIAPGQKANGNYIGMFFRSSILQWYVECTH